jgi:phosphoglycolate phosphatase-like HAD superfamily hydrolase
VRLVCFDIDGTLVHTHGAGRRAIHRALVEVLGTAGPIDRFRFDGRTDGEIVLRLTEAAGLPADEDAVQRVLARYEALLGTELSDPAHATHVYPGVRAVLEALGARRDCVLGLLTGNVVGGARLKLRSAGIDPDRFAVGAYGSDHHVRAELPAIARRRAEALLGHPLRGQDVVIIGDTPADMTCGQGIGARAIGVGTASYTTVQLTEAGAHAAFADLSDTAAVVEAVFADA